MTGVEAISNGVPAFKKPESKNAATTLIWMAGILIIFFMGISFLADQFQARPTEGDIDTIISQLSRVIFGNASIGYFIVQAATTAILILSANTSFADFPRLASLLSRDKFLPHIFAFRGDRLAFTTGIVALGGLAAIILLILNGDLQALIPLFAVGVFLAFTLSQSGMVVHWQKEKRQGGEAARGATRSQFINGLGALCTGIALVVIAASKSLSGAWIVVLLIPVLFLMFKSIYQHYQQVAAQLDVNSVVPGANVVPGSADTLDLNSNQPFQIVVPIGEINRVSLSSLKFSQALGERVTAVFISDDHEAILNFKDKWEVQNPGVRLVILETPFRSVRRPLMAYLDDMHERARDEVILVVLPEFVVRYWWEQILHNQTALRLKSALLRRPGVVVLDVPYQLQ